TDAVMSGFSPVMRGGRRGMNLSAPKGCSTMAVRHETRSKYPGFRAGCNPRLLDWPEKTFKVPAPRCYVCSPVVRCRIDGQRCWPVRGASQMSDKSSPRIGVIGTGAIGGFYGLMLARAGMDVHFLL